VSFSADLRRHLSALAREYARAHALRCVESRGESPVICFKAEAKTHGNFLASSYRGILANPEWRRRLRKQHSHRRSAFASYDGEGLCELDSCNSSDALLMNVFCYPRLFADGKLARLLGLAEKDEPVFGFRAHVPLTSGLSDATEVDMRLGHTLFEAKLTESDFQTTRSPAHVERYRDLEAVFDVAELPRDGDQYVSYQLVRNVLAAHAHGMSFCVLLDARRPDLKEKWVAIMRCVRPVKLRVRCQTLTWQELAVLTPPALKGFLREKYGIERDL